jgi:hypothetical protein
VHIAAQGPWGRIFFTHFETAAENHAYKGRKKPANFSIAFAQQLSTHKG